MTDFAYPSEKFSVARSTLMLPHPRGEAASITDAFHSCSLGLAHLDKNTLDDDARRWVMDLDDLMNTDGLEDPDGKKGLWMVKAETLTDEQKSQLSLIIDSLAVWFNSQMRGG